MTDRIADGIDWPGRDGVVGVFGYNKWQENAPAQVAEAVLKPQHADVLLGQGETPDGSGAGGDEAVAQRTGIAHRAASRPSSALSRCSSIRHRPSVADGQLMAPKTRIANAGDQTGAVSRRRCRGSSNAGSQLSKMPTKAPRWNRQRSRPCSIPASNSSLPWNWSSRSRLSRSFIPSVRRCIA